LREAQAQLEWTLMSVRHSTLLVKQGAIRPVQLENDVRANAAALAAVESATLDVETALRNLGLTANPGHVLRPGQRVRVQANTETIARAVVVPERAVAELQGVHRVWVVRPDNRVWSNR
jgi:hypothetical protein